MSDSKVVVDPMFAENPNRFVVFPIQEPDGLCIKRRLPVWTVEDRFVPRPQRYGRN